MWGINKRIASLAGMTVLGLSGASIAIAQSSVEIYEYDALGRLVQVTDSEARTDYHYDDASNRENVKQRKLYETHWLATSLPHNVGYADQDGWAADVSLSSQHMTYGPYTTGIPLGDQVAVWNVMIDDPDGPDDNIVTLDVYDATAGEMLNIITIQRDEWLHDHSYQAVEIPFTIGAANVGNAIEFRTFYHSNAYVRIQKIGYYSE